MKTLTSVLAAGAVALSAVAGASATFSFSFSTGTPVYRAAAPVCRNEVRYDFFGQPYWTRVCENVRRAAVVSQPVYPAYVYDNGYNTYDNTVYYTDGGYYDTSYYNNGYDNRNYRNTYPNVPTTIIRNPQNNVTSVEQYSAPVRLR